MKKTMFPALVFGAFMMLASCSPGESEQHYTAIYYPNPEGVIYADQLVDSLKFITFDDWKVSTGTEWASVSSKPEETMGSVPYGYVLNMAVPVYFESNKGDKSRTAIFQLTGYERVLSAAFIQHPYHNITRPAVKTTDNTFSVAYGLKEAKDSLVFTAYSPWTLTLEADEPWVTTDAVLEGAPGRYAIYYNVAAAANEDAKREAHWKLSSAGVTTVVDLTQKKQ